MIKSLGAGRQTAPHPPHAEFRGALMGGISIHHRRSTKQLLECFSQKFLLDRYLAACSSDVQPDLPQRSNVFPPGHDPAGLVEGILRGVLR